ncbi:MAG: DUF4143 domain-containing protein [Fibromonadaceae bacterium]|jgi:predicted AAA+ superfamily ATPase|nr:DUF4143 domain-containing protein [Fibromonadaceae bacterium]
MKVIDRQIENVLKKVRVRIPVVALLGPKQSGKKKLIQEGFTKKISCIKANPTILLSQYEFPIILDEIHQAPKLLADIPNLVAKIDDTQIFLTGLPLPSLKAKISETLGELVRIFHLMPLSIAELNENWNMNECEYIYFGFMPEIHEKRISPAKFYENYKSTYLKTGTQHFVNKNNRLELEKFMKLLAEKVGQSPNLNSMAKDIGVSSTTLAAWLNGLEASGIIFKLPCYIENFGKRLIKSPKVYFMDIGFAAYFLGIENPKQVATHSLFEKLFENMIITEALKASYNKDEKPELYYFKDNHGFEIDLIWRSSHKIHLIDINTTEIHNPKLTSYIQKFSEKIKEHSCSIAIHAGNFKTPFACSHKAP